MNVNQGTGDTLVSVSPNVPSRGFKTLDVWPLKILWSSS